MGVAGNSKRVAQDTVFNPPEQARLCLKMKIVGNMNMVSCPQLYEDLEAGAVPIRKGSSLDWVPFVATSHRALTPCDDTAPEKSTLVYYQDQSLRKPYANVSLPGHQIRNLGSLQDASRVENDERLDIPKGAEGVQIICLENTRHLAGLGLYCLESLVHVEIRRCTTQLRSR